MPNEITAIRRSLAPATFSEAMDFARMLAKSDMIPVQYKNKPENILLAIQWGMEVGLGPLQAVQSVAVINGKPSVFGDALLALVRGSPACEDVIESFDGDGDNLAAVCIAKRRGKAPVRARFSVADAKKAGLWNKQGPWQQYPRRMLQMRARGFALRDAFPDLLHGVITREEADDYPVDVSKREPIDITPPRETRQQIDSSDRPSEIIDAETGEVLDVAQIEREARSAAHQGRYALSAYLKPLPDDVIDRVIRPLLGTKDNPGELRKIARDADARPRGSFEQDFDLAPAADTGEPHPIPSAGTDNSHENGGKPLFAQQEPAGGDQHAVPAEKDAAATSTDPYRTRSGTGEMTSDLLVQTQNEMIQKHHIPLKRVPTENEQRRWNQQIDELLSDGVAPGLIREANAGTIDNLRRIDPHTYDDLMEKLRARHE